MTATATITNYKQLAGAAADEIEKRGWIRGTLTRTPDRYALVNYDDPRLTEDCPVCAIGGMNAAVTGNPLNPYIELPDDHGSIGYGLFDEPHPLHKEARKISDICRAELGDSDPARSMWWFRHVYLYNDDNGSKEKTVALFRRIEAGEFDSRFEE